MPDVPRRLAPTPEQRLQAAIASMAPGSARGTTGMARPVGAGFGGGATPQQPSVSSISASGSFSSAVPDFGYAVLDVTNDTGPGVFAPDGSGGVLFTVPGWYQAQANVALTNLAPDATAHAEVRLITPTYVQVNAYAPDGDSTLNPITLPFYCDDPATPLQLYVGFIGTGSPTVITADVFAVMLA